MQIRQSAESEISPVALYCCEESKEKEKSLHSMFDDVRERGEWFRLNDEQLAYVANLPGLSPTTFEECKPRSTRPLAAKTGLISLRIPDELLARIDAEAKSDRRSRNQTILLKLEASHGHSGVDEHDKGAKVGGGRNGAGLPVLPKAKSSEKRLHPLQSVRGELAGGRDAPSRVSEPRSQSVSLGICPHGKLNQAYCHAIGGGCRTCYLNQTS